MGPSPKLGTLGHSAVGSRLRVDTGQSQALPTLSTRLPALTPGTGAVGEEAALVARRFVHPTIPTRACCCGRLRARRPSSAPSAQCGHCHRSGTNGVWRGRGGQGGGAGSRSRFGGCSQRKPGAEPLCLSVSTPLLSTSVPAEMHSRHEQPRAGLFKVGSTSFWSSSPPGSLDSLWSRHQDC